MPCDTGLDKKFLESKFVLEIENDIVPDKKKTKLIFTIEAKECFGKVIIYNPDKWKYTEFYFFESIQNAISDVGKIYEILHISK